MKNMNTCITLNHSFPTSTSTKPSIRCEDHFRVWWKLIILETSHQKQEHQSHSMVNIGLHTVFHTRSSKVQYVQQYQLVSQSLHQMISLYLYFMINIISLIYTFSCTIKSWKDLKGRKSFLSTSSGECGCIHSNDMTIRINQWPSWISCIKNKKMLSSNLKVHWRQN